MPIELPQYGDLVEDLKTRLHGLPGVIVGIDGRDGVGKTTLGRFLAWKFNVTLIETDVFRTKQPDTEFHYEALRNAINIRLEIPRPVIVDGICLNDILSRIDAASDISIYVQNRDFSGSESLQAKFEEYEGRERPTARCMYSVEITDVDS